MVHFPYGLRRYCLHERPADVFSSLRAAGDRTNAARVPPRPQRVAAFEITIADLDDFAAEGYASRLDAWCVATLRAYGQGAG